MLPCLSVRTYVHTTHQRYPLSEPKSYDQNFMKLGHIVKYNNVFFKFDNGPYRTMASEVIALCAQKFTILMVSVLLVQKF